MLLGTANRTDRAKLWQKNPDFTCPRLPTCTKRYWSFVDYALSHYQKKNPQSILITGNNLLSSVLVIRLLFYFMHTCRPTVLRCDLCCVLRIVYRIFVFFSFLHRFHILSTIHPFSYLAASVSNKLLSQQFIGHTWLNWAKTHIIWAMNVKCTSTIPQQCCGIVLVHFTFIAQIIWVFAQFNPKFNEMIKSSLFIYSESCIFIALTVFYVKYY